MNSPLLVAPDNTRAARQMQAFKSQLADWIALQRSDATPHELARMYAVSVTAYRAANLRATVVSNVPYRVVDKKSGEPIDEHPLNALIRDNVDLPEILFRSEVTSCFWGHDLIYKRRVQRKRVTGLQWINPKLYRPRLESFGGRLVGFDISVNWHGVDYDEVAPEGFIARADAIYTHGVDFDNDFDGVSPAENAFDMAGIETEAAQTAVWFLRNRAIPAGLLQPKDGGAGIKPPDQDERNAMKRLINRILRGARNAGKTIVTSGRWEWVEMQSRFDQVEFRAQHETAREGVSMAFDVPLDLLLPNASTYAELYMSDRSWVEYFAKNRCRWYARHLTKQLAAEYGDDIRIEPNFAAVFQRDDEQTVSVTNNKLQGGYMTLYDAQLATGHEEPDERLKDIYMVGSEPVHIDRLVKIAIEGRGYAPQWSLDGEEDPEGDDSPDDGGNAPATSDSDSLPDKDTDKTSGKSDDDGESKLPPQRSASVPSGVSHETPDPNGWLPEAVFKELRTCVRVTARRGAEYDFISDTLPVDVVAYVRLMIALSDQEPDIDDLVTAARSYVTHDADWRAMKAYANVETRYRAALFDLIRKAFARQLDQQALDTQGQAVINTAYEEAFLQGLADVGMTAISLSEAEAAIVREHASAERRHWTRLAGEVMDRLVTAQDKIEDVRQRLKAATDPAEQEQLRAELLEAKQKLIANRDQVLARIDLWAQGLRRMYSQGQLSGERNPMMTWHTDHAKENCRTCNALDGQVHRASEFAALELYPGSMELECVHSAKGVPVCGCGLRATPGARPRGSLATVPRFGSARSLGIAAKSEWGEPAGTAVLYLDDSRVITFQDQLIAEHPALTDARWTPAAYLHITLAHSPLVVDDAFEDIFAMVTANGVPSFELHASRLDAFEVGSDHRAIVLLIDDDPALQDFQRRIVDEFQAREIPLSEYSDPAQWQPHITLGYERSSVAFEPREVDIAVTTGTLAFSRGDYVNQFQAAPGQIPEQEQTHAVSHD